MSKRVYATKASQANEFADHDGYGWFKDISDEEFEVMRVQGRVFEVNGRYFAADSVEQAQFAESKRQQVNNAAPENRGASFSGGLYSNPGATLKGIATLICVLGMIASVILAFVLGYTTSIFGYSEFNAGLFFAILIGGGVLSYLSGLGLAAFGDLVLSANEIKRKLK